MSGALGFFGGLFEFGYGFSLALLREWFYVVLPLALIGGFLLALRFIRRGAVPDLVERLAVAALIVLLIYLIFSIDWRFR